MIFNTRGLTDLGYRIFLDRYAAKGLPTKAEGTYALVKHEGAKTLCRILGQGIANLVEVALIDGIDDSGNPKYSQSDSIIVDYMSLDFPIEWDPATMWARVSKAVGDVEIESETKSAMTYEYLELLTDWKFVPGGRILAAAGIDAELSYYNCFVIPNPVDSKHGIFESVETMSQLMSRGGGVGLNISSLRPRYSITYTTQGRSSGAVSWGEIYSFVTGLIEQGGSRRGALLLILEDWHPDIEEFIKVKRDMKRITNANISVGISDKFMEAVRTDSEWNLIFPDTKFADYDDTWDGNIKQWIQTQGAGSFKVYKTVKARDLWNKLIESAHACAEPGLWFKDRANAYSNSWYFNQLVSTNPCVTGDTLVAVADGRGAVPIKELAEAGNDVPVYCYNPSASIAISTGRNPRITGFDENVWEVVLDDGSSIKATANHKFMMRDGTYTELQDLKIGDSLMPFRKRIDTSTRSPVTIIDVSYVGTEAVYNLTVDDYHNYAVLTSEYEGVVIANCGEQSLPAWGVCNLGAINLSKFVSQSQVLWDELAQAVRIAVRFLDSVIDLTPYHFPENENLQKSERRIGLGTMGLAEMLLLRKIPYGSEDSLRFIDELYKFITYIAYEESIALAEQKGPFSEFQIELLNSEFAKNLSSDIRDGIRTHGLRNVTLLTQAPTGTTGTMVNTSTGIEPYYFWEWTRKGRMGESVERVRLYDEWVANSKPGDQLPDYFVTAQDLTPEQHIRVQATIQKWVDSSISKTCNVPEDYTVEQVGELYQLMYALGCKGGTVYRDNSRSEQVLNLNKKEVAVEKTRSRPDTLTGKTFRKQTPAGTLYITINEREDGPFEVFLAVGKAGSELAAQAEALGRLISYILRLPSQDTPAARLQTVAAQLKDIGSGRSMGFGPNRVGSMADGIAQVLEEYAYDKDYAWVAGNLPEGLDNGHEQGIKVELNMTGDLCPDCGNASFCKIEGCKKCIDCGYSEC